MAIQGAKPQTAQERLCYNLDNYQEKQDEVQHRTHENVAQALRDAGVVCRSKPETEAEQAFASIEAARLHRLLQPLYQQADDAAWPTVTDHELQAYWKKGLAPGVEQFNHSLKTETEQSNLQTQSAAGILAAATSFGSNFVLGIKGLFVDSIEYAEKNPRSGLLGPLYAFGKGTVVGIGETGNQIIDNVLAGGASVLDGSVKNKSAFDITYALGDTAGQVWMLVEGARGGAKVVESGVRAVGEAAKRNDGNGPTLALETPSGMQLGNTDSLPAVGFPQSDGIFGSLVALMAAAKDGDETAGKAERKAPTPWYESDMLSLETSMREFEAQMMERLSVVQERRAAGNIEGALEALEVTEAYLEEFFKGSKRGSGGEKSFASALSDFGNHLDRKAGKRGLANELAEVLHDKLTALEERYSQQMKAYGDIARNFDTQIASQSPVRVRYLELRAKFADFVAERLKGHKELAAEAVAAETKAAEYFTEAGAERASVADYAGAGADMESSGYRFSNAAHLLHEVDFVTHAEAINNFRQRASEAFQKASRYYEQVGNVEQAASLSSSAAGTMSDLARFEKKAGRSVQAADLHMQAAEWSARELRLRIEKQRMSTGYDYVSDRLSLHIIEETKAAIESLDGMSCPDLRALAERVAALPDQLWGGEAGIQNLADWVREAAEKRPPPRGGDLFALMDDFTPFRPSEFSRATGEVLNDIAKKMAEQGDAAAAAETGRMAIDRMRASAKLSEQLGGKPSDVYIRVAQITEDVAQRAEVSGEAGALRRAQAEVNEAYDAAEQVLRNTEKHTSNPRAAKRMQWDIVKDAMDRMQEIDAQFTPDGSAIHPLKAYLENIDGIRHAIALMERVAREVGDTGLADTLAEQVKDLDFAASYNVMPWRERNATSKSINQGHIATWEIGDNQVAFHAKMLDQAAVEEAANPGRRYAGVSGGKTTAPIQLSVPLEVAMDWLGLDVNAYHNIQRVFGGMLQ